MALCKKILDCKGSLKVVHSYLFCRYHPNKTDFPLNKLVNEELCPEAFHSIYPLAFSMLYANIDTHVAQCNCPGIEGNIVFELQQVPVTLLRRIVNAIKKCLSFIHISEVIKNKVIIKVKQANPRCPYGYHEGGSFNFNLGKERGICPAAFYNIFPSLMPKIYAAYLSEVNKQGEEDLIYACPDHLSNICFKAQDKDGNILEMNNLKDYQCCKQMSDLVISVKAVTGICPNGYKDNEEFVLKDIIENLKFPCLTALHTAYPYIEALLKGGELGFYTDNYKSAIIQCPNAEAKVEMKVELNKEKSISITILNLKNNCPSGLVKGLKFIFSFKQLDQFCLSALMAMYPYLINYEKFLSQEIICPGENGKVCFNINKE